MGTRDELERYAEMAAKNEAYVRLVEFISESNRIEGITRAPTRGEIKAHQEFLELPEVGVPELECFVTDVAARPLRDRPGMNVRVGGHFPPKGGPFIREELGDLLLAVEDGRLTPYAAHIEYEQLHPFMDGNGRSGRVLWAWHMRRDGLDPFSLPFLHRFYYQTLDANAPNPMTQRGGRNE